MNVALHALIVPAGMALSVVGFYMMVVGLQRIQHEQMRRYEKDR